METSPTAQATSPACCDSKRSRDLVANLRESTVFCDYQAAFQRVTGLPLVLRPVGAFQSSLVGAKNASQALTLLSSCNHSSAAYLRFEGELEKASLASACTLELPIGLVETLIPLRMGSTVVAFLQTGHVAMRRLTAAKLAASIREWSGPAGELPVEALTAAVSHAPVIDRAKYASIISMVTIFAGHLAIVANQLAVSQTKAELPAVARARSYIEQHQAEEISLGDVAKAVNMSAFYFCKVFRRVTGVTFVEYLARLRIERVKQILQDPHTRVSEAAFAAGFQSLSQFNRVFLRIAGESPTAYRDRILGPASATLHAA